MKNDRISSLQFSLLAFFLISSFLTLVGYHILTIPVGTDVIFSILIGTFLGFGPLIVFFKIFTYRPELSLLEKIEHLYPRLGNLLRPLFALGLLLLTFTSITILTDFIHLYLLKDVPVFWIRFTFVAVIFYIMTKNLETICRTSEISFYLFFLFFILSCIGVFSHGDLQNLKPLLAHDSWNIFQTGCLYALLSTAPLFLLLMIPKKAIDDAKKFPKRLFLTYLFSSLLILLQFLIPICVLGIDLTNLYLHPEIAIYKKVAFLNIIERVETVLAAISLFYGLFYILLNFYTAKEAIQRTFRIPKKKEQLLLVLFSILILFLSHYVFFSDEIFVPITFVILFLFPILLAGSIQLQTKKKKTH